MKQPLRAGVNTYHELVTRVAQLATANRDQTLLYRGQAVEYRNREGNASLYPSIYRGDPLSRAEARARFQTLTEATTDLASEQSVSSAFRFGSHLEQKYSRWAVLQHYKVCSTPFLDVTHSLHVACSFASLDNSNSRGFVYVLGFPHSHSPTSMFAEEDLLFVRLLSVCPHQAKRPHFQEAYVAATLDVTHEYDDKSELDFNRRLVAIFEFDTSDNTFWGDGFGAIPRSLLFPDSSDELFRILQPVVLVASRMARPGDVGHFLAHWSQLEKHLRGRQTGSTQPIASAGTVIQSLVVKGRIDEATAAEMDSLRRLRNRIVHSPTQVSQKEVMEGLSRIMKLMDQYGLRVEST